MNRFIERYKKEVKVLVDEAEIVRERADYYNPHPSVTITITNARKAITMTNMVSHNSRNNRKNFRTELFQMICKNEYDNLIDGVRDKIRELNKEHKSLIDKINIIKHKAMVNYMKTISLETIKGGVTKQIGTEKNLPLIKEALINVVKGIRPYQYMYREEHKFRIEKCQDKFYVGSSYYKDTRIMLEVDIDDLLGIDYLNVHDIFLKSFNYIK